MDAYQDFAYVYDELMDATPYEAWCERIDGLIRKYGISKPSAILDGDCADEECFDEECCCDEFDRESLLDSERNLVVDLGCGTGTLTELLYQKGYDMIGIDNAEEMLNVAMEKKAESGSEILYLLQDMRELELYSTVGTVVSVCDSVNYILEEDELAETFSLVNNYLYPGGIFIFDFNTQTQTIRHIITKIPINFFPPNFLFFSLVTEFSCDFSSISTFIFDSSHSG